MLEKMDDFFTARVDGYDEHMRNTIEGASSFYKYTASLLPEKSGAKVLDLGCGTGLELEEYFLVNPFAKITGIDLTEAMLNALKEKFADSDEEVIFYRQELKRLEKKKIWRMESFIITIHRLP